MRSANDYSASRNLDPSELENAAGGSTKKVSIESGRDNGKGYRDEPHCKCCQHAMASIRIGYRCKNPQCDQIGILKSYIEVDWY